MRSAASPVLSLLLLLPSTIATSLSQFQSIANFPAPCETAYNSQISGCTDADFSHGAPCSATCIRGLQTLTTQIESACAGSQADPNTLIGMFFVDKGVTALCPNYAAPVASVPATSSSSQKPAVTTSTPSAVVIETSTTGASSLSTSMSQAPYSAPVVIKTSTVGASSLSTMSSAPPPPPTTSAAPSSSTASVQPVPVSTLTTTSTTTATLLSSTGSPDIDKTAINDGSKTIITSKADQTASSNADAFGGGGSPFEISAGVKGVVAVSKVTLLAVVAGLALVL